MNQQQNAASFAHVLAVSLVGKFQAWNLVKHQPNLKTISLIVLCFCGESVSCGTGLNTTKISRPSRHSAEFIYIKKQYDFNGLHYTLSIIDSVNRYSRIFTNSKKVIPVNKETAKGLIRPILYTLKKGNVTIQVMYLDIMRSCYEKYNTYDGWIAIHNSRRLIKIDSLGSLIHQIDVEIGKNASVTAVPPSPGDLMCEDAEVQELLDCSAEYNRIIDEILKFTPK